jgi:hypothetical protein
MLRALFVSTLHGAVQRLRLATMSLGPMAVN